MSLSLGILLLSRITEKFGIAVEGTAGTAHAFPRPEDLANVKTTAFRQLGFSRQKGLSLIALARSCIDERGDLEMLAGLNNKTAVERLLELRGVGRMERRIRTAAGTWTTERLPPKTTWVRVTA